MPLGKGLFGTNNKCEVAHTQWGDAVVPREEFKDSRIIIYGPEGTDGLFVLGRPAPEYMAQLAEFNHVPILCGGRSGDNIFGNSLDNIIYGGAGGDDILSGQAGHDTILWGVAMETTSLKETNRS